MFVTLSQVLSTMPLPPGSTPLAHAKRADILGTATIDQIWLVREHQEARRNLKRGLDWAARFKLLGPWS